MISPLFLALAAVPQSPRTPIPLGQIQPYYAVELASDEDLSGALAISPKSTELRVWWSDGRGVEWSGPTVVKPGAASVLITQHELEIDRDNAVIAWVDSRHQLASAGPASTPFVRTYDAASGVLGPELELSFGVAPQWVNAGGLSVATQRIGAELHVHVAVNAIVNPPGGPYSERVVLFSSYDGGATFPSVLEVASGVPFQVYSLTLLVADDVVHVGWIDARDGTRRAYYRRSIDAGHSLEGATEQQLTTGLPVTGLRGAARHSRAILGYMQEVVGTGHQDVLTIASLDSGATFAAPVHFPGVTAANDGPVTPQLAYLPSGALFAVWYEYNQFPEAQELRCSRSLNSGATWETPVQLAAAPLNKLSQPRLAASKGDRARVVVGWSLLDRAMVRTSLDDGATFGPAVSLSYSYPLYLGAGVFLAWNERYQNAIAAWVGALADPTLWIGGLRPQTLTPLGFSAGSTHVSAQCSAFDDGSPVAFVLASLAPGSFALPFGDGRVLGLDPDALFVATLESARQGSLATPLDASGSGATPGFAVPALPAGLSVDVVGVALDPTALSFGDISDLVHVQL